jgi:CCR4-NOT transcription complex subunit 6
MFNRVLGKNHIAVICLFKNIHTRYPLHHRECSYPLGSCVPGCQGRSSCFIGRGGRENCQYLCQVTPAILDGSNSGTEEESDSSSKGGISESQSQSQPPQSPRQPPIYHDRTRVPLIICGDFSSVPNSGVYEFLEQHIAIRPP